MLSYAQIGDDSAQQLAELSVNKQFLNREFLLWLWHQAEEDMHYTFTAPDKESEHSFTIWIDDRVALDAHNEMSQETVLKGGRPSLSQEAAICLIEGKSVKGYRIGINIESIGDFFATLSCKDLDPKSLRLPPKDELLLDYETSIEANLYLIQLFLGAMDKLHGHFLQVRLSDAWENETVKSLKNWISDRHKRTIKNKNLH